METMYRITKVPPPSKRSFILDLVPGRQLRSLKAHAMSDLYMTQGEQEYAFTLTDAGYGIKLTYPSGLDEEERRKHMSLAIPVTVIEDTVLTGAVQHLFDAGFAVEFTSVPTPRRIRGVSRRPSTT